MKKKHLCTPIYIYNQILDVYMSCNIFTLHFSVLLEIKAR